MLLDNKIVKEGGDEKWLSKNNTEMLASYSMEYLYLVSSSCVKRICFRHLEEKESEILVSSSVKFKHPTYNWQECIWMEDTLQQLIFCAVVTLGREKAFDKYGRIINWKIEMTIKSLF